MGITPPRRHPYHADQSMRLRALSIHKAVIGYKVLFDIDAGDMGHYAVRYSRPFDWGFPAAKVTIRAWLLEKAHADYRRITVDAVYFKTYETAMLCYLSFS